MDSESTSLSEQLGFLPNHVAEPTEHMKTLLLNCYQFNQTVLSQEKEITKLKHNLSSSEDIKAKYRSLEERVLKLNNSKFESMMSDGKLDSASQTGDCFGSFPCPNTVSFMSTFNDRIQELKNQKNVINTGALTGSQLYCSCSPLTRCISLPSNINILKNYMNSKFLCLDQHDLSTNYNDREKCKSTSNLTYSVVHYSQVGMENDTGVGLCGQLDDINVLLNCRDTTFSHMERRRESTDSGNVSQRTCNSLSSNVDIEQSNQLKQEHSQERFISDIDTHNGAESRIESDCVRNTRDLVLKDHCNKTNDSKSVDRKQIERCEKQYPNDDRSSKGSPKSKKSEPLYGDIPVSSIDHEHFFKHLCGGGKCGSDFDSSEKSISNYFSCSEDESAHEAKPCEPDIQRSSSPKKDTFDGNENVLPNKSFPFDLVGKLVSTSSQEQTPNLLPLPQMISKAVFDKLTLELVKVKTDNNELQKIMKDLLMKNNELQEHMMRQNIESAKRNAEMNIDMADKAKAYDWPRRTYSESNAVYEGDEHAQMNIDLDVKDTVEHPFVNSSFNNQAAQKQNDVDIHDQSTSQSSPPDSIQAREQEKENQAAQLLYIRDLEKKNQQLYSNLQEEEQRSNVILDTLKIERKRFARDIENLKQKIEKKKGDGKDDRSSGSKSHRSHESNIHVTVPRQKMDKVQYVQQGARPKQRNKDY